MINFKAWTKCSWKSFEDDEFSSQLILYLEGNVQKVLVSESNNEYVAKWSFTPKFTKEYEKQLRAIKMYPTNNEATIRYDDWDKMKDLKNKSRTQWHEETQKKLARYLYNQLGQTPSRLEYRDITDEQRLSVFKEFYERNKENSGSIPLFNGIFGLFQYQLKNKHVVAEWHMLEYKVTQTLKEGVIADYLRLLRGVLGLEYLYTKTTTDPVGREDKSIVWLVNDKILNDSFIKQALSIGGLKASAFPTQECHLTDIPRECDGFIIKWSYKLLSLFHHYLK